MVRPGPIAQMQAGLQGGGEAPVARNHQKDAALPADFCCRAAESDAVGIGIVTQDHAGYVRWQAGDDGERVGQAGRIGEEPEGRVGGLAALLYLPCPGD